MLRSDFALGDDQTIPLVGFAQLPTDSRSACVVVLAESPEPRKSVEACRAIGAPLVFVCCRDSLQWWKQGRDSAEWLESVPAAKIDTFFCAHQDQFSPEAIYRAKTLGRVRSEYQLDFVDVGVMPLIEEEVGTALSRLISRNVAGLKSRLGWDDVTSEQGHWLLQTVFWLVSGKILRDKQVPSFADIDLGDIEDVFLRVARHYGTEPFKVGSKQKLEALRESAHVIEQFSSLALTTTESLAYVYENTLISTQTRSQLGTHSTPSYLVDYVLGHLADWIEEIPENERSVFEPACGHAAFLVSAMRLLTQLLPYEKAVPSRRGPYLRNRLHGTDVDAFALELARLSLTLTDIPNPDGWDLRVEDMFIGDRLRNHAKGNTILLANPPFAKFEDEELTKYSNADIEIVIKNKAAEMLRLTLPQLKPGSVFGFVLPQSILHGSFAKDVRHFLINNFELREVALFPDKVFQFSDAESAVIIGRRLENALRRRPQLRFRRIREWQLPKFRQTYEAPSSRIIDQSRFQAAPSHQMLVPDLEEVWLALRDNPKAADVATLRQGLIYHGTMNLPTEAQTYSENKFPDAQEGFVRFQRDIQLHDLPKPYWMSLDRATIRTNVIGSTNGTPQVLMNYAPVSRGPWRLKALLDRHGHPITSRFIFLRPTSCSLESLWGIINSPVANAFTFCHLGKRDHLVSVIQNIPMPDRDDLSDLETAVATYFSAASEGANTKSLQALMSQIDAVVMRMYDLPIELEQSLLSLFSGWQRAGVPFEQTRFLPEQLEGKLRFAEFVDYEADWSTTNRRRGELIDKEIAGKLSPSERSEFEGLQAYADYHLDQVAPRPTAVLEQLEDIMLAKAGKRDKDA
ncbi:MAG: SAM-dependent DNA methyltransferase [Planctomycetaceae bacterium]|nr:SAM-dependent DNA methyltransferase [Planctomycetaceae bacterium]